MTVGGRIRPYHCLVSVSAVILLLLAQRSHILPSHHRFLSVGPFLWGELSVLDLNQNAAMVRFLRSQILLTDVLIGFIREAQRIVSEVV